MRDSTSRRMVWVRLLTVLLGLLVCVSLASLVSAQFFPGQIPQFTSTASSSPYASSNHTGAVSAPGIVYYDSPGVPCAAKQPSSGQGSGAGAPPNLAACVQKANFRWAEYFDDGKVAPFEDMYRTSCPACKSMAVSSVRGEIARLKQLTTTAQQTNAQVRLVSRQQLFQAQPLCFPLSELCQRAAPGQFPFCSCGAPGGDVALQPGEPGYDECRLTPAPDDCTRDKMCAAQTAPYAPPELCTCGLSSVSPSTPTSFDTTLEPPTFLIDQNPSSCNPVLAAFELPTAALQQPPPPCASASGSVLVDQASGQIRCGHGGIIAPLTAVMLPTSPTDSNPQCYHTANGIPTPEPFTASISNYSGCAQRTRMVPDPNDPQTLIPEVYEQCGPSSAWLANAFVACPPGLIDHVWGPSSVRIDVAGPLGAFQAATNGSFYNITVNGWNSSNSDVGTYTLYPSLQFAPFSHRSPSVREYHLAPIGGTIGMNAHSNLMVDAMLLSGRVAIENGNGPVTLVAGGFPYAGGIAPYRPGQTEYAGSFLAGGKDLGLLKQISAPEFRDTTLYVFREADGSLLGSRWLLKPREVMCSRTVLAQNQGNPALRQMCDCWEAGNVGCGDPFERAVGEYNMLVRGPSHALSTLSRTYGGCVEGNGVSCTRIEKWQLSEDYEVRYGPAAAYSRQLNPGELIRVVALNHASGYVGSVVSRVGPTASSSVSLPLAPLVMRPPNLKISAKRILPASGTDAKQFTVGSEGSALTSDVRVEITTEWYDFDGSALPAGLRYTGRIARGLALPQEGPDARNGRLKGLSQGSQITVCGSSAAGGGTCVPANSAAGDGTFQIVPGTHQVVALIPDALAGPAEIYIHVDGADPTALGPTAMGTGQAPLYQSSLGPDFSVISACYWGHERGNTETAGQVEPCDGIDNNGNSQVDEGCEQQTFLDCQCRTGDSDGAAVGQDGVNADDSCLPQEVCPPAPAAPTPGCINAQNVNAALAQRPWLYVPVKVPFYSKSATDAARTTAKQLGLPKPSPVYLWQYRPEYHFSLLNLESVEISQTTKGDTTQIYDSANPAPEEGRIIGFDVDRLDILSVLLDDAESELPRFGSASTPSAEREVAWQIGGQTALEGPDGYVYFENPSAIEQLDEEDLLVLALVQKDDEGNLLRQFAYERILMGPQSPAQADGTKPDLLVRADDPRIIIHATRVSYLSNQDANSPPKPYTVKWSLEPAGVGTITAIDYLPTSTESGRSALLDLSGVAPGARVRVKYEVFPDLAGYETSAWFRVVTGSPNVIVPYIDTGVAAVGGVGEINGELIVRDDRGNNLEAGAGVMIEDAEDLDLEASSTVEDNGRIYYKAKGVATSGPHSFVVSVGSVRREVTVPIASAAVVITAPATVATGQKVPVTFRLDAPLTATTEPVRIFLSARRGRFAVSEISLLPGASVTHDFSAGPSDGTAEIGAILGPLEFTRALTIEHPATAPSLELPVLVADKVGVQQFTLDDVDAQGQPISFQGTYPTSTNLAIPGAAGQSLTAKIVRGRGRISIRRWRTASSSLPSSTSAVTARARRCAAGSWRACREARLCSVRRRGLAPRFGWERTITCGSRARTR